MLNPEQFQLEKCEAEFKQVFGLPETLSIAVVTGIQYMMSEQE